MIKGVNKQVLEIVETQNGFFEKAIFFVKPEYSGVSENKLRESAKKEMESAGSPPKQRKHTNRSIKSALILGGCFLLGLIIGIISAGTF